MPNTDIDDDCDLAVLWQNLQMGHEIFPHQQAWMDRHEIKDLAGLEDYREKRMEAFNLAAGFVKRGSMWYTKGEIAEMDAKAEAAKRAAAEKAAKEAPQLSLGL